MESEHKLQQLEKERLAKQDLHDHIGQLEREILGAF